MVYFIYMDSCLRYTSSGYVFISPEDNPDTVVDALLRTDYAEEFCVALDFDPLFIARLMAAGFLVMSMEIPVYAYAAPEPNFLLMPKLHLTRSVLFFSDLHIKKSIKPLLQRYELRVDTDFQGIMERCVHIHGDDWLTLPLRESLTQIRGYTDLRVRPVSFGVYRNGELKAGEFGVLAGRVYTSYSGYYDENSAGTVQMILTAQYLQDQGFAFFDLGMPMDYKNTLGACTIEPQRFVRLFRAAQNPRA
ncbi:MAG: GNAT family N-acetyltransferase [Treponema sp.]|jgi:Leu/Phe-tRNA-protein transferase|nr:GNAT family N-acetyltransferase [Treponema sp.]